MVDVKDEDVAAGWVAALAEDAYETVEEPDEAGVVEEGEEEDADEDAEEVSGGGDDEVDAWLDGTE